MYLHSARNQTSPYYPGFRQELNGKTLEYGRFLIGFGIPATACFVYQDIAVVKLPELLAYRLLFIVPLALYTLYFLLVRDKAPATVEALHSLLLTSAMAMVLGINYHVDTVWGYERTHSFQALGALAIVAVIVYLLSASARRWLHLIVGVPYGLFIVCMLLIQKQPPLQTLAFYANATLIIAVLLYMAYNRENAFFRDFETRKRLDEELRLNHRIADELKHSLDENLQLNRRLEFLATYDSLTGTYNRRAGLELLDSDIDYSKRHRASMALIFIDVDGLKATNDRYGHAAGDTVILSVTGAFSKSCRFHDYVIRMGGDEFLIVLKNCSHESRTVFLKRVNDVLNEAEHPYGVPSFSYGIAVFDPDVPKATQELIQEADMAMYCHKRSKAQGEVVSGEV